MANNHTLDNIQTKGRNRVQVQGTGYFSGSTSTGSLIVVEGAWSGSIPVGANDASQAGVYIINLGDSYAGLVHASVQIHSSVPGYMAQFSGTVSGSSNLLPTLLSGTAARPNSQLVVQTFLVSSSLPNGYSQKAVPSGSTPYFLTFNAMLRNSSGVGS